MPPPEEVQLRHRVARDLDISEPVISPCWSLEQYGLHLVRLGEHYCLVLFRGEETRMQYVAEGVQETLEVLGKWWSRADPYVI